MAIVYKSIKERYDDVEGKWTAGTDNIKNGIIAVSQNTSGATNQSTTVEVLLASNLDNMDTSNVLAFNPMAGSFPVANSDNTKAYNGDLAKLLNPNYGIGVKTTSDLTAIESQTFSGFNINDGFTYHFSFVHTPEVNSSGWNRLRIKADNSRLLFWMDKTATTVTFINGGIAYLVNIKEGLHHVIVKYTNRTFTVKLDNIIVVYAIYESDFINPEDVSNGLSFLGMGGELSANKGIINYITTDEEDSILYNSGRPDRAILPYYMKWGSKSKYNSTYAGNEVLDAVGWYSGNATALMPVGLKRPNAIGLYDMNGNTWEWCWDRYGETYPTGANNPTGASSGSVRVLRGGSWYGSDYYCMVSIRYYDDPVSYLNLGFRLCRKYSASLLTNDVVVQAKTAGMQAIGLGTYTDCTIDSFLMQKYVVTVQEYSGTGTDMKPKVDISWYDVCKYANQKSSANSLDKCYHVAGNYDENTWGITPAIECNFSKSGYRLPTEAEWEWAARQGSVGAVTDLEPSGIVVNSSGKVTAWADSSDNNNDATVSGTPDLVIVKAEDYEGQGIINSVSKRGTPVNYTTASPTLTLDGGSVCEYVTVKNNSANSLTISVGTSAGGVQLVNSQTVATGAKKSFPCTLSDVSESSSTIYVTASGTGLDYDVNLVQRRV